MAENPHIGGMLCSLEDYPDHLRLIGRIVTDFSGLEGRMSLCMWALVDSPDLGSRIFSALGSTNAKLQTLTSLAEDCTDGAIQEEILAALKDCKKVSDKRNQIAHWQWGKPFDAALAKDPYCSDLRSKRKSGSSSQIYTLEQLQEIVDAIAAADRRLDKITTVLMAVNDPRVRNHYSTEIRPKFPKEHAYWSRFDRDIENAIAQKG